MQVTEEELTRKPGFLERIRYGYIHDPTGHFFHERGIDVTEEFIPGPPGSGVSAEPLTTQESTPPPNARDVFVIHGRNAEARNALFDFLRAIDLHPLEWSEAVQGTGKASPYIGEILDSAFSRAHAVVALFTPDDEARIREPYRRANEPTEETRLRGQARPNVLFESGMALARHENRTVLVELGDLRPFSDVAGRHAIRIDNSSGWRQDLAQRLETAGCPVNRMGNDWLTAGDFNNLLAELSSLPPPSPETVEQQLTVPDSAQLSGEALELLLATAQGNGRIVQMNGSENALYRAGNQNFGNSNSARSQALWKRTIRELSNAGLIEAPTNLSQSIPLTDEGFRFADSHGEA